MDPLTIVAVTIGLVLLGGAVAAVSLIRDSAPPPPPEAAEPPPPPKPKPITPPAPPRPKVVDVTRAEFTPGVPIVVESPAPVSSRKVVFEDDGKTGVVSVVEPGREPPIVDTVQVYDVQDLPERKPSVARVRWTPDGSRAALLIDDVPHALVDYDARSASCRAGLPKPAGGWTRPAWDERRTAPFRDAV